MPFSQSTATRRILLIDDDVELAQMLREYLESNLCQLTLAHTGAQGLALLARDDFDLVLLDLMLPDGNGLDLLKHYRRRSRRPVIMFTAHGDETDRVLGLEFGADDYLTKPFSPRELKARITAVQRRFDEVPDAGGPPNLTLGALSLDPASGRVRVGDEEIALTGAEQRILEILMRTPGQVVARDQIGLYALGRKPDRYDRSIDTHISALRKKLKMDNDPDTLSIRNQRGRGYVLTGGA